MRFIPFFPAHGRLIYGLFRSCLIYTYARRDLPFTELLSYIVDFYSMMILHF